MKLQKTLALFIIITASILFQSCVNYDQKTTLSIEGSGIMKIHYWTLMNNFTMGTSLGNFEFDEQKIPANYTSSSTSISNLTVEDNLVDSTKHVNFILNFENIRKLSEAKGFKDVVVTWNEVNEGKDFKLKYIQLKDTSASNNMGASDYTITYTFDMPGDVINTNATEENGNTLTWKYKVSDLKDDLEMNALVRIKK